MSRRDLIAEFPDEGPLLRAIRHAKAAGYRRFDAYVPFAVEGLTEMLELPPSRIRLAMLLGGLAGAAFGFGLQYYSAVVDYPLNLGGRPLNSWPAFMLITIELAILFAALAGLAAFLVGCRLTRLHQPIFEVAGIERASQDRFFLVIAADDPKFDPEETPDLLRGLGALSVREVPR